MQQEALEWMVLIAFALQIVGRSIINRSIAELFIPNVIGVKAPRS